MKQSLVFSVLVLLISSSSSSPTNARNKSHPAKSPVATPAPGPSNSDCSTIIYSMMDCLSYLSIPSTDDKPGKTCCEAIETVLEYNPHCVCVGLESSQQMGIPLNNTRALDMPSTCKISIAPPHCDVTLPGASTPGLSPGMSPVSPSTGTPMTSPSSAESPSTSPSLAESPAVTAPSASSSATNNLSVSTLALLAVIVSSIGYLSTFSN